MGKEQKMQPSLFVLPVQKDIVYTPNELAQDMIDFFDPSGLCLDPCAGDGMFYNLLPKGSMWCEIESGVDFYSWGTHVDWIISNPPYSNLLAWIRHSFDVADNIVYLMPLHRVFASASFLKDLMRWGGVANIRLYGTGSVWGFPFGHSVGAVHYVRGYRGDTSWSDYYG